MVTLSRVPQTLRLEIAFAKESMITSDLQLNVDELPQSLLPLLQRRVFHVTTAAALRRIVEDGAIRPNRDGSLTSWPRYDNAYFRATGCVSLCDLRSVSEEQIRVALGQYYFLDPEPRDGSPVFLFIRADCTTSLISWREQRVERPEMLVVSYIEAGYRGNLPLECVEEALSVDVIRPPLTPHLEALLRIRNQP